VQPVSLPADHRQHPGFGMEWWYSAGLVRDARGHRFSYFATIWSTPRFALAHVNLIDLETGATVVSRDQVSGPLPGPTTGRLAIAVGKSSYGWRPGGRYGRFTVHADTPSGTLDLRMVPRRAYTLHGTRGVIQQGLGGPSAYYSATRLAVTATLTDGGRTTPLTGEGWFDHQWGNFQSTRSAMHWDWFACRLDDGRDLILYRFLGTDNRPMPAQFVGTYVSKKGAVKHLRSFLVDERAPIAARPDLGADFPLGWRLRVPQVGLDLRLQTLNEHQFIRIIGAGTIWEGAARTTRGPKGLCYVEDSRTIGLG